MNQVKTQLALIRDARAADWRFQKVTWMGGGRDQASAHKLGAGTQHICNSLSGLPRTCGISLLRALGPLLQRSQAPRGPGRCAWGLGWVNRLGTHISVCLVFCICFFFLILKEKDA